MKKLLTLFCSICATALFAQDYFYAYYSDGTVNQFTTTNIDSISLVGPDGVLSGEVYDGCGNKYNYVKIGKLFWMTKNLRCCNRVDNTMYVSVGSYGHLYSGRYDSPILDECCVDGGYQYDLNSVYKTKYCPKGWRLPTKNELNELLEHSKSKGVSLLSSKGWSVESNDEWGFSIVPAGYVPRNDYISCGYRTFIPSSDSGQGLCVENGGEDIHVGYFSDNKFADYAPIRCCRETNVSEDGRMKIKNN